MHSFFKALKMVLWLTLLTGVIYPMLITAISLLAAPKQARGSFVTMKDKQVGSLLIGQKFISPRYFWSRPSAVDFNPLPSGGSNLNPTSTTLKEIINKRRLYLSKAHGEIGSDSIPSDLLYASGSGLDPHITTKTAYFQIERVATERKMNETQKKELKELIAIQTISPFFGFPGEPYLNVLILNIALDLKFGQNHDG